MQKIAYKYLTERIKKLSWGISLPKELIYLIISFLFDSFIK